MEEGKLGGDEVKMGQRGKMGRNRRVIELTQMYGYMRLGGDRATTSCPIIRLQGGFGHNTGCTRVGLEREIERETTGPPGSQSETDTRDERGSGEGQEASLGFGSNLANLPRFQFEVQSGLRSIGTAFAVFGRAGEANPVRRLKGAHKSGKTRFTLVSATTTRRSFGRRPGR